MTDDMELAIDLLALASHPHDVAGAQETMRKAADRLAAYDARPVAGDDVERVRTAQKWAEGLISQLPDTHDGRNSWLLNYGASDEADKIRAKWNHEADQRHAPPSAKYRDLSAIAALPPQVSPELIEKLVKLANYLTEQGEYEACDLIDTVVERVTPKAKG